MSNDPLVKQLRDCVALAALCYEAADMIEELSSKLEQAVAIAKDAIETMEEGPFFPEREGQRLLAALAELKGQDDG